MRGVEISKFEISSSRFKKYSVVEHRKITDDVGMKQASV